MKMEATDFLCGIGLAIRYRTACIYACMIHALFFIGGHIHITCISVHIIVDSIVVIP
jgi:hypothetical protein